MGDGKGAVRANMGYYDIPYRFRTVEGELQGVGIHSAIGCDANEVIREIVKWCSRYNCQFIELTDEGVTGFQKLAQLEGI
ncbi:hypothetical protein [Komagataeibacter intermedius]|uniref:Uncharacterized protein n=1 Tax=Komagataeibacter intermedius NRIC 0521 TaxID=1307934 RepID=A0ABQ0PGM3_9PROT|nr:hypothetical protein [Komagataeibacter intermedius]GAN86364.1 hypothetical protein Gain_0027_039 [Komagataeibacter intermedius TF2]GBQ67985.1 hypothetical protein AA0521_1122 [Komagataeibacter intermedius NRIC 0521]